MTCANVVLPVPGPHKMMDEKSLSASMARRKVFLADDMFLPDIFIQRARTHARRERRFAFHAFLQGVEKSKLSASKKFQSSSSASWRAMVLLPQPETPILIWLLMPIGYIRSLTFLPLLIARIKIGVRGLLYDQR